MSEKITKGNDPEVFRVGVHAVSAREQTVRITIKGFRFNTNGDLMGRPSIRLPDREINVPFPKGMELIEVMKHSSIPKRCNGMDVHLDEVDVIVEVYV